MSEICCKGTGEPGTRCEYDEAGDADNMDLQDMAVRCYKNAIKIIKKGGIE